MKNRIPVFVCLFCGCGLAGADFLQLPGQHVGVFFMKEPAPEIIVQNDGGIRKKIPDYGKQQTDLAHQVKGLSAVIPYVQAKPPVYDQSCQELQNGYNNRRNCHQPGVGMAVAQPVFQQADDNKTDAA